MKALVKDLGPKKWSIIASHLPGRIGKQCRERWHNHLNPDIRKDACKFFYFFISFKLFLFKKKRRRKYLLLLLLVVLSMFPLNL